MLLSNEKEEFKSFIIVVCFNLLIVFIYSSMLNRYYLFQISVGVRSHYLLLIDDMYLQKMYNEHLFKVCLYQGNLLM